ncbi:MAG TPA: dTMP kinase [Nitrospira sp.]
MKRATKRRPVRGQFITLEGPEGSGKSTHIRHLAAALRRLGYRVVQTREPGGTVVAEAIRQTLLRSSSREQITPIAESLLIFAARSQHVRHVIEPALQCGAIVLCDRFSDSTFAYQGFARGLDLAWLRTANSLATNGCGPNLTLLLDVPVHIGLSRRRKSGGKQNRLDLESVRFHRLVRKGFLTLAAQSPRRIRVIRADRSEETTKAEIEAVVLGWLRTRQHSSRTR